MEGFRQEVVEDTRFPEPLKLLRSESIERQYLEEKARERDNRKMSEKVGPTPLELATDRQRTENYEAELIPQAISLIRGVLLVHPNIRIHQVGVGEEELKALQHAEGVEEFKRALQCLYRQNSRHVVETAEQDLRDFLHVLHGSPGSSLGEVYQGQPILVLQVNDITNTAKSILGDLKAELLMADREPVLATTPLS